ncbi:MAG TPA: hypothetical protein VGC62_04585 [Pseudomonas sp.]|uniref:hypothetical protein n=1 Tax=Pseudomonas sp. TaxID=306 RepID=UPI002EDAA008
MNDDDLMKMARALAAEVEAQPQDGQERSISVTIGGNNGGHITIGGTQIVISSPERERSWHDLSTEELREHLEHWRAQWWSGWRGFWLNPPCVMLVLSLALVVAGLFSGWLLTLHINTMPYVSAVMLVTMAALSTWMMRIRRVEGQHMERSQAYIDTIESEMRQRR